MSTRIPARSLVGLAVGAVLAVGAPLAASAHVTIDPGSADPGFSTDVVFRAPNESSTASTVRLEVHLPADTPFTNLRYEPTPGWTTTVVTGTLPQPVEVSGNTVAEAPTSIVFEAQEGHGIQPGQFQTFTVALGPVPAVERIVLPVTQTYSDGTVVEWEGTPDEVAADDGIAPAPVLYVEEAPPGDHHGDASASDPAAPAENGVDGRAIGMSIAALALGAGGVVLAAIALANRRKADA